MVTDPIDREALGRRVRELVAEVRELRAAIARYVVASGAASADPRARCYQIAPPDPTLAELVAAERALVEIAREHAP